MFFYEQNLINPPIEIAHGKCSIVFSKAFPTYFLLDVGAIDLERKLARRVSNKPFFSGRVA